jgi:putative PIN family toxin of toxin-antitoxin system
VLRTKFLWPDDRVQEALSTIRAITKYVSPTETLAVVKEDPDDDRVLEAAVAGLSEVIVTGDADLLALGRFRGMPIVTVSRAVAMFDRGDS